MDAGRDEKWGNVGASIPLSRPDLSGNELKYVTDCIKSGWITHKGKYVTQFEDAFSKFVDKESISCSSGTAALHLALLACGIGPGDEVIVPDLTFANTASVVKHVGATPVLVDIGDDFCIDVNLAEAWITERTKAIIPVHLYGMEANISALMRLAYQHNLWIIEDCCEALWIKPTAHYSAYSFYGNKTMTTGEGGMLSLSLSHFAKQFRDGGFDDEYNHSVAGLNYRMTNLQAALGCAQLERVDEFISKTLQNAAIYNDRLNGKGEWLFVTEGNPKSLRQGLKDYGIETRPVFWPLHLMKPYENKREFYNAVREWKTGICLPTGPHLTMKDIDFICEKVEQFNETRWLECR